MADETDIYNSSDPGGGEDERVDVLKNFKIISGSINPNNPFEFDDGILYGKPDSYQFSPKNAFDISHSSKVRIEFSIKANSEKYYDYFLGNWAYLGNPFVRVTFNIKNNLAQVVNIYTADNSSVITSRGSVSPIYKSISFNEFYDCYFEFDIANQLFIFDFDGQQVSKNILYPYHSMWAPGFGCHYNLASCYGILGETDFDLKKIKLKIDGSTVWGNE